MTTLDEAYARCEEITRLEARNFSYGIRLLPDEKRKAMSALYAFARRVDDIGDGVHGAEQKLQELELVRHDVEAAAKGAASKDDPVLFALGHTLANYPVPVDALLELVSGCELDCRASRYESFEELLTYCRYVAGSIGRMSLGVFGTADPQAFALADTLGIALQLTNILRDIVEDRDVMGRVYLPREDLERFGCSDDATGPIESLCELVRFEAARAKLRYNEGLELLELLDRRSRACVAAMAGIYRRLLGKIEHDPASVLDKRVSLPTWEKAWVAARSLAGARS